MNPEVISLLDADPDLGEGIDPDDRELAARHATTRVTRLTSGEWDATTAIEARLHHRGFLVVDGLLSREVEVMGRGCVELVGHGDIVRPWSWDDVGSHVPAELAWTVLEPTRASPSSTTRSSRASRRGRRSASSCSPAACAAPIISPSRWRSPTTSAWTTACA